MNSVITMFLKTPIAKHQQGPQPAFMCSDAGFEFFKRPLDDRSGKRGHEASVQQGLIHHVAQWPAQPGGQWRAKPHLGPMHKVGRKIALRQLLQQVFAHPILDLVLHGRRLRYLKRRDSCPSPDDVVARMLGQLQTLLGWMMGLSHSSGSSH